MHKARGELLLPVNGSIQTQFQVKTIQGLQVTRLTGRPTFAFEFFIQFEMLPASPLTLHLVCQATGNTQLFSFLTSRTKPEAGPLCQQMLPFQIRSKFNKHCKEQQASKVP